MALEKGRHAVSVDRAMLMRLIVESDNQAGQPDTRLLTYVEYIRDRRAESSASLGPHGLHRRHD